MPRKRKSKETTTDTETATATATMEPPADTSVEPQADTSAVPESSSVAAEPAPVVDQTPPEQAPNFVERLGERIRRPFLPDPYTIALDNAAGVRLFENRQDRVMAIRFDEKPSQPVIDRVKEEGYRWNPSDGVWTHTLRGDAAMSTRIDAERLYQEVRQMIRHDKGIDAGQDIPF